MHQFKGTVLPALRAGSSSLATNVSVQNGNLQCISEMCLFLCLREHRQDPAIPTAPREGQGSDLLYLGAREAGLSPSDLLQTLKSNTPASQSMGGGSSADPRGAPGHSLSGPREERQAPGSPTLLPLSCLMWSFY